jgi:very-short-patch-repair endonuclease
MKKYLDVNNIEYIKEKMFNDCNGRKRMLLFDYYLPKHNMLLEYDGIQHFIPIKYFGGEKAYNSLKIRDEIKNNFAKNNNIGLLRIKYSDINNINQILKEIL